MIFASELETLNSEIETYQKLLHSKQQQLNIYREVAGKSQGYLIGLKELITQVSALSDGAIASLKSEIDLLFRSDGGGNAPAPEPTPGPEGTQSFEEWKESPQQGAIPESLDPLSTELCTPIACLLEDCPESSLTHQAYELTCRWECDWELEDLAGQNWEISTPLCCLLDDRDMHFPEPIQQKPYYELVLTNNTAIAYFRKHKTNELGAIYIGGNAKNRLQHWADWLRKAGYISEIITPRKSKRLQSWKWELKLPALPMETIREMTSAYVQDKMPPRIDKPSMPPKTEPLHPIHNWQPGDKAVRSLTPSETWELTTAPSADGKAFAVSLLDGRRDLIPVADLELVAAAAPSEPDTHSILETDDIVKVLDGKFKGQVGTVRGVGASFDELPIAVELPSAQVNFRRCHLGLVQKGEGASAKRQLQTGDVLMGDRVVTSGAFVGVARRSRAIAAKGNQAEKLAQLELQKDMKAAGLM